MKEKGPEGSIYLSNDKHGFGYKPEFKDWLKEHPHAMAKVAALIEEMINNVPRELRNELSDGDIKVIYLDNGGYSDCFKVIIGEDKFFIKRDQKRMNLVGIHSVGGLGEYADTAYAKHRLKNNPDIEVIDSQLGYTKNEYKNRLGYFVSKWEDMETVSEHLARPNLTPEEIKEIKEKLEKVRKLFHSFHDIKPENMFYNPKNKKIMMFDLNENPYF